MPIVAATGAAVTGRNKRSERIESAMSRAILDCAARGITNPTVIRSAMLAEHDRVMRRVRFEDAASPSIKEMAAEWGDG